MGRIHGHDDVVAELGHAKRMLAAAEVENAKLKQEHGALVGQVFDALDVFGYDDVTIDQAARLAAKKIAELEARVAELTKAGP